MIPLGFHVLVKPDPVKEKMKSGLIEIPDEILHKERIAIDTGTLVGIGACAWKDLGEGTPWANVGDRVIYAKYGGKFVKDPNTEEELVLLNDKDIIGLV